MAGVLISTIYEKSDATKLSIRDFKIEEIFLLIDKEAKDKQIESINLIKRAFEDTIKIVTEKVDLYDILSVSMDVVKIIDSIPTTDKIYVDISQGRKPQALGLLLACYSRANRIEHIVYWGEDKKMTILPKLSFGINGDEKKILEKIVDVKNVTDLIDLLNLSRSKLYRLIKKLEKKEFLQRNDNKFLLTDAGKIAIL